MKFRIVSSACFNMYFKPVSGYHFPAKMDPQPPFWKLFGAIWDALQSEVGKVKTMLPPAREHRNQALGGKRF